MLGHPCHALLGGLQDVEILLQSSFGPLGLDKIVANDVQQVVCTTNGSEILSVLHPTDPLLGVAVRAAQEFALKHGDGSKRVLLMTAAGARQAMQEAVGMAGPACWSSTLQPCLAGLCHSLAALQGSGYVKNLAQALAEALMVPVGPTAPSDAPIPAPNLSSSSSSHDGSSTHCNSSAVTATAGGEKGQPGSPTSASNISDKVSSAKQEAEAGIAPAPHTACAATAAANPGSQGTVLKAVRRVMRAILTTSFTVRLGHTAVVTLVDLLTDLVLSHLSASSDSHADTEPSKFKQPDRSSNCDQSEWSSPQRDQLHRSRKVPGHVSKAPCKLKQQSTGSSQSDQAAPSSHSLPLRLWTVLRSLRASPPLCQAPGSSVSSSRLLQGVLLRQGIASRHMDLPAARARFVVLDCSLDPTNTTTPASVRVASAAQHQQLLQSAEDNLAASVQVLANTRRVGLIICTHRCSDLVVFRCLEAGMALVAGVDEGEARALCRAAGIQAATSYVPSVLKEVDTGVAAGVSELRIGPYQNGVLVELSKCGVTALVCGPSEGLCKQYAKCMVAGLRLLESACAAPTLSCSHLAPPAKPLPMSLAHVQETEQPSSAIAYQAHQPQHTSHCPRPHHNALAKAGLGTPQAPHSAHSQLLDPGPLPVLPGGGAFDAALATLLQHHIHQLRYPLSMCPGRQGAWAAEVSWTGDGKRGVAQHEHPWLCAADRLLLEACSVGGGGSTPSWHHGQLEEQQQENHPDQSFHAQQQQQQQKQPHHHQHELQKPEALDHHHHAQQQQLEQEQRRQQLLLPGLRVLHAMALAVPRVLAQAAQGQEVHAEESSRKGLQSDTGEKNTPAQAVQRQGAHLRSSIDCASMPTLGRKAVSVHTAQRQAVHPQESRSERASMSDPLHEKDGSMGAHAPVLDTPQALEHTMHVPAVASSERAPKLLVHELLQAHFSALLHAPCPSPTGLVVPTSALHKAPGSGWPLKPCAPQSEPRLHHASSLSAQPEQLQQQRQHAHMVQKGLDPRDCQQATAQLLLNKDPPTIPDAVAALPLQAHSLPSTSVRPGVLASDHGPPTISNTTEPLRPHPRHTSLPSTSMRVGLPAQHGLVEPVQLLLALWEAASSLLMQLLRVDAVVPARRIQPHEGPLTLRFGGVSSLTVKKGGVLEGADSNSGTEDEEH